MYAISFPRFIFATSLFVISVFGQDEVSEVRTIFTNVQADCTRRFPNISDLNSELVNFPDTCRYRCLDGQVEITRTLIMPDGWPCATNRTCLNGSCKRISEIEFCSTRISGTRRVQRVDCQILCTDPSEIAYAYNLPNGTACNSAFNGDCRGGVCVQAPIREPPYYPFAADYAR